MSTGFSAMATPSQTRLRCSVSEWDARVELAALYRVFAHFAWTDLTYTHLTLRLPDEQEAYLTHPYGLLFDEVTASSLVKVDFAGNVLTPGAKVNGAGQAIHSAILRARPEVSCVVHSHTRAGAAVSAMRCGLLPVSEHANAVLGTLSYHAYNVVGSGPDECEALVQDLGGGYTMVLGNHGLLACGRTVAEAFLYHYFLETACRIQVDLCRSGAEWVQPPDHAVAALNAWGEPRSEPWGSKQWAAVLRLVERQDPSFRN